MMVTAVLMMDVHHLASTMVLVVQVMQNAQKEVVLMEIATHVSPMMNVDSVSVRIVYVLSPHLWLPLPSVETAASKLQKNAMTEILVTVMDVQQPVS